MNFLKKVICFNILKSLTLSRIKVYIFIQEKKTERNYILTNCSS